MSSRSFPGFLSGAPLKLGKIFDGVSWMAVPAFPGFLSGAPLKPSTLEGSSFDQVRNGPSPDSYLGLH